MPTKPDAMMRPASGIVANADRIVILRDGAIIERLARSGLQGVASVGSRHLGAAGALAVGA